MTQLTRRQFLRSAGGVTFLALTPLGRGLFAAPNASLPRFTALPYLQPGPSSRLIDGQEIVVVAWQTEAQAADFTLEYGPSAKHGHKADVVKTERWQGNTDADKRFNYVATLSGLKLSHEYFYRLRGNGQVIAEGHFQTRKKRGEPIKFVAFGDNAYGTAGEIAVAYYAYKSNPDFIMNTGDNVYEQGLDSQYAQYFFPIYNAPTASPTVGAPLLCSVPFYTVMANHDVHYKDVNHSPIADFDKNHDSLAYYTAMSLPMNGPTAPAYSTPMQGPADIIQDFQSCAGSRFPRMANYSFDYGDAHFTCLDSNTYVDPRDPALQAWIAADLQSTDAAWKFVIYHHPAFNVGPKHFQEQQFRVLSPLFEEHGVDVCLHGHEHVYQRTMPLRFAPSDTANADPKLNGHRLIPGTFTVDTDFDGKTQTKPNGIIYITTGAGGKELYDHDLDSAPAMWLHPEDNNVAYNAHFVSTAHSFTQIEINGPTLTLTQIDETGLERDRIQVTKA
jgi:hypothetical protein